MFVFWVCPFVNKTEILVIYSISSLSLFCVSHSLSFSFFLHSKQTFCFQVYYFFVIIVLCCIHPKVQNDVVWVQKKIEGVLKTFSISFRRSPTHSTMRQVLLNSQLSSRELYTLFLLFRFIVDLVQTKWIQWKQKTFCRIRLQLKNDIFLHLQIATLPFSNLSHILRNFFRIWRLWVDNHEQQTISFSMNSFCAIFSTTNRISLQ